MTAMLVLEFKKKNIKRFWHDRITHFEIIFSSFFSLQKETFWITFHRGAHRYINFSIGWTILTFQHLSVSGTSWRLVASNRIQQLWISGFSPFLLSVECDFVLSCSMQDTILFPALFCVCLEDSYRMNYLFQIIKNK